jgi:hypothetical protein
MNWEAVSAIGEVLGAVAVVITLIYLSIQVRQNSQLAKATLRENRTDSSQKVIFAIAEASELMAKDPSLRSEAESLRFALLSRAMFRDFEASSYQHHAGLLDESEWKAMKETWRDIMASQTVRAAWSRFSSQYSQILHDDLKEILSEEATRV